MGDLKIVSREQWKARPPRTALRPIQRFRRGFRRVAIHYSTGQELGRKDTAAWVREIQAFHQDTKGWSDIGYNFLVAADGTIYEGRGWEFQGAHCPGRNHDSIGICFLGNDDPGVSDLTEAAKVAINLLIDEFARRFGKPLEIFPHRKHKATQCPGDEITAWIAAGLPSERRNSK